MTKEATLRYLQPEYGQFILCTWKIEGISWKILDETRKWSDETVHLHGPRVWLKRTNKDEFPPKYELNIKGRGHDDRCTWCKSFRTALSTKMKEELNITLNEIGCCDFD